MPELQNPPVPAPESNLVPGMAAPIPLGTVAPLTWTGGFPNIADTSGPPPVPNMEPPTWVYDFDPASGIGRATFNGNVRFTSGGSATAGVTSFNTRTGDVTLSLADVTGAGGAPIASPALTGTPTVPTAAPGTATTQAASTAFVGAAIAASAGVTTFNGRGGAVTLTASDVVSAGGAPTASPALTGTPTAPTAAVGDNSSAIATTAYVNNYAAQNLVLSFNGRRGAVTLSLSDITSVGGASLTSPTFLGTPAAPTAAPGTSTTQIATTAFVENAVTAAASGVVSWNGRSGVVSMTLADVTSIGGAPLLSPALTGTPTAPTASAGTNSTQLATTAFVETAISSMAPVVSSFNGRTGSVTLQLADVTSVGGAPLASPTLTGTPAAPTPTAGDNSTRIATTAFVANYLPLAGGTLTGALSGTTANFSGNATANAFVTGTATTSGVVYNNQWLVTQGAGSGGGTPATPFPISLGFVPSGADSSVPAAGWAGILLQTGNASGTTFLIRTVWQPGMQAPVHALVCNSAVTAITAQLNGSSTAVWSVTSSDSRLKYNRADPTTDALGVINAVKVYQADYQHPASEMPPEHLDFTILADDIETALPAAYIPPPEGGYASLHPLHMISVLWRAVQQLSAKVEALEAGVAAE